MSRAFVWCLGLCLFAVAQEANAQGLLGKPYVSGQYLLLRLGDDFDAYDTDLGNGGRLQGNIPLLIPDSEQAWGFGLDAFTTFSGLRFDGTLIADPSISIDSDVLSGDVGLSFYARATENIRPFVQLGINWTKFDVQSSLGLSVKESDTGLVLTAGVEVDVFPFAAVRASYGRGADGFGDGFDPAFLGEVIWRPGDHWFGRFSASIDNGKTVIGGFGAGFAW